MKPIDSANWPTISPPNTATPGGPGICFPNPRSWPPPPAPGRWRGDIVTHLKLREPKCYVASFNRPNLTYRVIPKNKPYDQLLNFLRARPKESGIVYCMSRKSTESVAANLS